MEVIIQCSTKSLSKAALIPKLTFQQIENLNRKAKGKTLVPFVIAEEGKSFPKIIGEGNKVLHWSKAIIQKLKTRLKEGTKLFNGHNADNSTSGRKGLGEVIESYIDEEDGKSRIVALTVFDDEKDIDTFDVCSIETQIDEENGEVTEILDDVTGIAVGSSATDKPAFDNAKALGKIQCFQSGDDKSKDDERRKTMVTLEDLRSVPITLIKQLIEERQMHPNQLFRVEDIENDREFGKVFKDKTESEKNADALKKELEELKTKHSADLKETEKRKASESLKKLFPETLTDKQKTFLEKRFDPETLDSFEEDKLKGWIDSGLKEYQDFAKMFNEESPNVTEDKETNKPSISSIEEAFNSI